MMEALLKKLNCKSSETMFVFNAPDSFLVQLQQAEIAKFKTKLAEEDKISFAIAFVNKLQDIEDTILMVGPSLEGDAILWMCYPKASSKKYTCEFNRDTGWNTLGKYKLEPVKQVAIDEDWSALRFRKLEFIKKLTRKFSLLSDQYQTKTNA